MSVIKLLLVLLLCVPLAFVIWCFARNLSGMLDKREISDEKRQRRRARIHKKAISNERRNSRGKKQRKERSTGTPDLKAVKQSKPRENYSKERTARSNESRKSKRKGRR